MEASGGPCPGMVELEQVACGAEASPSVAQHLESCEACRSHVRAAREDATFLGRARELAGRELGPEGAPRIAGYRTLGVLSSGSQGVVYRAKQESTSRTVAIKVLDAGEAASSRQRARAEREAEIAARLGMKEGAVRVAVHRLRTRYRDLLRAEIAETVASPAEVDAEMQHLFAALGA